MIKLYGAAGVSRYIWLPGYNCSSKNFHNSDKDFTKQILSSKSSGGRGPQSWPLLLVDLLGVDLGFIWLKLVICDIFNRFWAKTHHWIIHSGVMSKWTKIKSWWFWTKYKIHCSSYQKHHFKYKTHHLNCNIYDMKAHHMVNCNRFWKKKLNEQTGRS